MREAAGMIIVLSLICGASGLALSYLKATTAPIIERQVLTFVQGPAIDRVFAAADNNPIAERKTFPNPEGGTITVFPYKQGGKLIGVALETFGKGYGGDIGVMVGFDVTKDTLLGIGITTMKETPGLGTQVAMPKFSGQFVDKPFTEVALSSKGGRIDAISGATVSSTGTVGAVQQATKDYMAVKGEIQKAWQ